MERAEFIFQIFFDSFDLQEKLKDEFTLMIRLFQLPVIEIDKMRGPPGTFDISTGKRLSLKMPYVEVLDACPMFIMLRTPRPGHTSERKCQRRVSLQNIFQHSIQSPGRYVQQKFTEVLKGRNDQVIGTVMFTVSVNYCSSSQETLTNLEPIVLRPQSSTDSELSINHSSKPIRKDCGVMVKSVIPDVPETRSRSVFYFDKQDLMEENRQLASEIQRLTDLVQRMKNIVKEHEEETKQKSGRRRTVTRDAAPPRPNYIYRPPGLTYR